MCKYWNRKVNNSAGNHKFIHETVCVGGKGGKEKARNNFHHNAYIRLIFVFRFLLFDNLMLKRFIRYQDLLLIKEYLSKWKMFTWKFLLHFHDFLYRLCGRSQVFKNNSILCCYNSTQRLSGKLILLHFTLLRSLVMPKLPSVRMNAKYNSFDHCWLVPFPVILSLLHIHLNKAISW